MGGQPITEQKQIMRTSILLNPAALQAELFAIYFHFKPLETKRFGLFFIEPSIGSEKLILNVYRKRELIACFEISRERHPELRSTEINDYHKFFIRQFHSIEDYFDRLNGGHDRPSWSSEEMICVKHAVLKYEEEPDYSKKYHQESIIKGEWFDMTEYPKKDESGEVSDDVLIDLTGDRKHYAIGYVAFDSEGDEWLFYHDSDYTSIIHYSHAKWTYLPLAKYDKK